MAGMLGFCHGFSKTVIRPPNFQGRATAKEGAGPEMNRARGQRSRAEAETGHRDEQCKPADRDRDEQRRTDG